MFGTLPEIYIDIIHISSRLRDIFIRQTFWNFYSQTSKHGESIFCLVIFALRTSGRFLSSLQRCKLFHENWKTLRVDLNALEYFPLWADSKNILHIFTREETRYCLWRLRFFSILSLVVVHSAERRKMDSSCHNSSRGNLIVLWMQQNLLPSFFLVKFSICRLSLYLNKIFTRSCTLFFLPRGHTRVETKKDENLNIHSDEICIRET